MKTSNLDLVRQILGRNLKQDGPTGDKPAPAKKRAVKKAVKKATKKVAKKTAKKRASKRAAK